MVDRDPWEVTSFTVLSNLGTSLSNYCSHFLEPSELELVSFGHFQGKPNQGAHVQAFS